MTDTPRRRGLGRGLAALIDDSATSQKPATAADTVPLDLIDPNPDQPRKRFDAEEIDSLAASIREKGVIQPLVLRPAPSGDGRYQIVAGERRWRAAQAAQLHAVPAVVRDFSDSEVLEVALLENIQRADLNPVEEAQGYAQLIERYGHTQERIAEITGKSRSHVANTLRLLKLPKSALTLLETGALTAGHARAALAADDPESFARMVVDEGLSVREAEKRLQASPRATGVPQRKPAEKDADTRALEADLSAALGLRVTLRHKADGKGELSIAYDDLDQLDGLCSLLNRQHAVAQ
jgi:ParB family chromosome partitioning protein